MERHHHMLIYFSLERIVQNINPIVKFIKKVNDVERHHLYTTLRAKTLQAIKSDLTRTSSW